MKAGFFLMDKEKRVAWKPTFKSQYMVIDFKTL